MTPGLRHFVVEIVAFPGALADAGEHRHAAMELGDVVDQFHDDDCLAHAGTAERSHLPAFHEGTNQVDDLDAGGEDFRRGRLVHELGRRTMDWVIFFCLDRPAFVNRVAAHIEYPAHYPVPDWHGNGRARVDDFVAAFETIGVGHGDGPDPVVTEVLLHFEGQFDRLVLSHKFDSQRVVDGRQVFREFDIHDRTHELNNFALIHVCALPLLITELAARNFEQFLSDIALPQRVVFEGQFVDQAAGIVCGILHGHHAGALFTGFGFQQAPVDENVEVVFQEIRENRFRTWFKDDLGGLGGQVRFGFRTRNLQPLDFANRQKLPASGALGHRVDELRRDDLHLIHVALQEEVASKLGNRPGFGKSHCSP